MKKKLQLKVFQTTTMQQRKIENFTLECVDKKKY